MQSSQRAGAFETVTYLELRSLDSLLAADTVNGGEVALVEETRAKAKVRDVLTEIGKPYGWPSQRWTQEEWDQYLDGEGYRHWFAVVSHEIAGLLTLGIADPDEIEIDTFGFLPDYVGNGHGGQFLTLSCRLAWTINPELKRLWLHTSTIDHPSALHNYLARGFTPYRRCTVALNP